MGLGERGITHPSGTYPNTQAKITPRATHLTESVSMAQRNSRNRPKPINWAVVMSQPR